MTIKHLKHGNQHILVEKTVHRVLTETGLQHLLPEFAITKSEKHEKRGKYHIVNNHITDGKKLIITEKGTPIHPETIEEKISDIPVGYPPLIFYSKNTASTFVRPGRVTFFATITKNNVKLHIPGGEATLPRRALKELRIKSISPDIFEAVLEYGGTITTRTYSKTAYTKALETYPDTTVLPFYDHAILIAKNGVYIYDGEHAHIKYPFSHPRDLRDFINVLSMKELIEILSIM